MARLCRLLLVILVVASVVNAKIINNSNRDETGDNPKLPNVDKPGK